MDRRPADHRITVGDRCTHIDGREGRVIGQLGSGEVWVILDDTKNVFALPGFWERIGSRLSAS